MERLGRRLGPAAFVAVLALVATGQASAQELGPLGDPFRVSMVGPDGPGGTGSGNPRLAYDPQANRYLATFSGVPSGAPIFKSEVYAQLIDARGNRIGLPVQISQTGDDQFRSASGGVPVYNPGTHEYLVVFQSNKPPLDQGKSEVFGQRLDESGHQVGPDDFRISTTPMMRSAIGPTVALNGASNEYLVAWSGSVDDDANSELMVRRLDAAGGLLGVGATQISTTGTPGAGLLAYFVGSPSIAYNPLANEFLVTWYTDRDGTTASQKFEIDGQRLSAAGAQLGGTTDLQISQTGAATDPGADAIVPSASFDPATGEYLVAFHRQDASVPDADKEVFAQRLAADGTPLPDGTDVRLTDAATPGEGASFARLALLAGGGRVLLYQAAPAMGGLAAGKREIWAQRLGAGTTLVGAPFRVSETGIPGDAGADALVPAVAAGPGSELLAAWQADPGTGGLATDEQEVFGRRVGFAPLLPPPVAPISAPRDRRRPHASFKLRRSYRLRTVLRRGLSFFVRSDEAGTIRATGDVPRKVARRFRLAARARPVTVARARRAKLARAGHKKVTLRFTRKARRRLAHARRVRLTVRVTATDRAGNATRLAHATSLRRRR
ncbi:MAG TPA: hypothetical protein VGF25_03110 [Thermoleophilaceae bacterium]